MANKYSYSKNTEPYSSPYFWYCPQCRHKNSNYTQRCIQCNGNRQGDEKKFINRELKIRSKNVNDSMQIDSLRSMNGKQTTTLRNIAPSTNKPTTSTTINSNSRARVELVNNNNKNKNKEKTNDSLPVVRYVPTIKSNNIVTNVKNDKSQTKISEQRNETFSSNNESKKLPEEIISTLNNLIRDITPISNEKSRSAFVQRLLRDTVKEFQDRHRQRERTLKNEKFIDQDFPTNRSSLYLSTEDSDRMYDRLITQWLRIEQISLEANSNKPLVVYENSIGVQDFRQGTIGDCWFICALACLTLHHASQLGMIIPNPKLCPQGIYQVFLCLDGKWQPLEIDDYFPCDQYKRLVFSQVTSNQIFAPIVEKALAKHHSCYKALSAGTVLEGFSNLTGMPCKQIKIQIRNSKQSNELFHKIQFNLKTLRYMISASCGYATNGLHANHAYSILDVTVYDNERTLLLWNPWGKQQLTGKYEQINRTISTKEQSNRKLCDGMFWIRFNDFTSCFDQIDICKFNTRWICERYEFSLPFQIDDQRNFTIFTVECTKSMHIQFTIYQRLHRDIKFKYRLDINLIIFRRMKDNSLQYVAKSQVFDSKMASFGKNLLPGRYVIGILGFNQWGSTSRLREAPKLVIAVHGSKPYTFNALAGDIHLIGDMLIELALKIGIPNKNESQNWTQYSIKKNFCSFISIIENKNDDNHLIVNYNTNSSNNAFTLRSEKSTIDIVPPNSRQIVVMLARECDKSECTFAISGNVYRSQNSGHNLSKMEIHSDVQTMSALFAPRRINPKLLSESNRSTHVSKKINTYEEETYSDSEDEDTWRSTGTRNCFRC
ncbi:hypothetical protein RDWZM_006178 [Blomia tropicalis]|uniref:Calpain-D-like n=1 Tax=Blomia tropicalis TaxID=40697 RepID=A0A9Q0M6L9_BLOTA|nr:hypothetical protein RDWZM_006178 [Blomia tropicalis]